MLPTPPSGDGEMLRAGLPSPEVAAENFLSVVDLVEPVAERVCRAEAAEAGPTCDFQIVVDSRPGLAPNVYQTSDPAGRPIIVFTVALIGEARNRQELAFVLGHEAAHHIAGHSPDPLIKPAAVPPGTLSTKGSGVVAPPACTAKSIAEDPGTCRYTGGSELEADALGAVIAYRAGFDPVEGAEFFRRGAEAGTGFRAAHPQDAERIETVRRTMADLQ